MVRETHLQTHVTARKRPEREASEGTYTQPPSKKKQKSKARQLQQHQQQSKTRKVEVAQPKKRKGKQQQQQRQAQEHQQETKSASSTSTTNTTNTTNTTDVMEQLESDDYFEVLGLARSATEGDVKKAYRRLAVLWHPDKNRTHPKAEEYFKKIGEAYAVLIDAEQRKVYECYGKVGLGGDGGGGASPSGAGDDPFFSDHFGFGFGGGHARHAGFSARHARDIFEAFFGGMDPFEEFFRHGNGNGGGGGRRQSRNRNVNEWDPMGFDDNMGFGGMGGSMGMGMRGGGLGGMVMMDSFFGGGSGMNMGMDMGGFADFGSFGGGGGGSFSSSVSSSSFTDRSGHVVTKKTTTTVDANGRSETVTEEFRNGKLVNSTSSSSTNRLADAGRMQMQLEGNGAREESASAGTAPPRRLSSSSFRKKF